MSNPNIIYLAVLAAGGAEQVSKEFKLSPYAVRAWYARKSMPADRIRPLCALGNHVIDADRVMTFIESERESRRQVSAESATPAV